MAGYVIMYGSAALCALFYAVKAYKKRNGMGMRAGNLLASVVLVNITYLLRIFAGSYKMASVFTSAYFIGMTLLLFTMFYYVLELVQPKGALTKNRKLLFIVLDIVAALDILLLIINIFREIELQYEYNLYSFHAIKYGYLSLPLFNLHMGLNYLLAVITLLLLLIKAWKVPKIYRTRYSFSFLALFLVIVLNCLYLSGILKLAVDVAVLVYGFLSPLVYWNTFDYSSQTMLSSTRKMILEYMGTPMLLFDYEGYVADANKDMRNLFPILDNQDNKISMMDFIQIGGFKELHSTSADQQFEWKNPRGNGMSVYQCTFSRLKDEKDRMIGHLLIMRDSAAERDMVTQLYAKQYFWNRMEMLRQKEEYPITAVVCNANSIGLINDVFGWSKGNEMLRLVADLLKQNLPEYAVIARMDDGDIAVGLAQAEQEYAVRLFENVREQYRKANDTGINSDLEYGIVVIRDHTQPIREAVLEARDSMRTKKLMNDSSKKSSLLDSLSQTLTESDYETEEHVERTKEMATRLGKELNLPDADLGRLALLAVLHDIGKIAIPHAILLKPGKLTDEEWEIMKTHTEKGYRIVSASKELKSIAEYILHHHERWDGNGYPSGLKGEDIPLLSRIITVVDSHDVMVHDRPYHKAMSEEEAVEELRRCSGTQFDPNIVSVFLQVLQTEESA